MTKIIIIFGIVLVLFAGFVFYQFANPASPETKKVTVNNQTFTVEVVKTTKDQQVGLTKFDSLPQDKGMFFQFTDTANHVFWMRGMQFPIDIIFLADNTVVGIVENAPPAESSNNDIPTYGGNITSNAALEINAGLSKKYEIKKGDKITLE